MSPRSKKEYVETIFLRYKQATREQKIAIPGTPYLSRRCHFTPSLFVLLWTRRPPPQGAAQTFFEPNDETLTPQRPARAFMFF